MVGGEYGRSTGWGSDSMIGVVTVTAGVASMGVDGVDFEPDMKRDEESFGIMVTFGFRERI